MLVTGVLVEFRGIGDAKWTCDVIQSSKQHLQGSSNLPRWCKHLILQHMYGPSRSARRSPFEAQASTILHTLVSQV